MKRSALSPIKNFVSVLTCLLWAAPLVQAAVSVSSPYSSNASGSGNSFAGVLSNDGNLVVFLSEANDLVQSQDRSQFLNIFARDLRTRATKLVSITPDGSGGANGNSVAP